MWTTDGDPEWQQKIHDLRVQVDLLTSNIRTMRDDAAHAQLVQWLAEASVKLDLAEGFMKTGMH